MTDRKVLWGQVFAGYQLWRTEDLPSAVTPVAENLESNDELVDLLTQLVGSEFQSSEQPLGEIFPMLLRLFDYGQIAMSTPLKNALGRNEIEDLPSFLQLSPQVLMTFRNVGRRIYLDLLETCIKTSLRLVHSYPLPIPQSPNQVMADTQDPPLSDEAIFTRRWRDVAPAEIQGAFRAALTTHYLGHDRDFELALVGVRDSIGDTISFKAPVTSSQLLDELDIPLMREVVTKFLEGLDANERVVLEKRIIATTAQTLDEVGQTLGFTRERARQIESKVLVKYRDSKDNNAYLGSISDALAHAVVNPIRLESLLKQIPQLSRPSDLLDLSVFEVLAGLEGLKVVEGWVYTNHRAQLNDYTKAVSGLLEMGLAPFSHELVNRVTSIWPGLNPKEAQLWLESLGWQEYEGRFVFASKMSQVSWAALVLELEGSPLKDQVIHDRLPVECSFRSFVNRLQGSQQFTRTGSSTYGLSKWGIAPFTNIHDMLVEIVRSQGSVSLSAMILKFTADYDVAENSVRHYSKVHPLKVENGLIKLADVALTLNRPTRKNSFKNFYMTPAGFAWRCIVTEEHLRGSGSMIPAALGYFAGVQLNSPKIYKSAFGAVRLSATGTSNNIGSLKNACTQLGAGLGDQLIIKFTADEATIQKADLTKTGNELVIELASLPAEGDLLENLTRALEMPESSKMVDILAHIEHRGDTGLLVALNNLSQ